MKTNFTAGWRVMAVAGLVSVAVPALAVPSLPAEQYQGPVGYLTGGVGQAEAKLFEQQVPQHSLTIELPCSSFSREAGEGQG